MVGPLQVGGVLIYKEARISLTQIFATREYDRTYGSGVRFNALMFFWRF